MRIQSATIADRSIPLPPGSRVLPPFQRGDQGVSVAEGPYADRLISSLLGAKGVEFVMTYRDGAYEIHGKKGSIRFERVLLPDGNLSFRIIEVRGQNPIPSTDPYALRTLAEEIANAGGPAKPPHSEKTSYPDIFRRVAQLFDSRRTGDLVYVQIPGGDPNHPHGGSHGSPNVTQSRAPLIMAGPGIARGVVTPHLAKVEDIAPTVAQLIGVAPVMGKTGSGRIEQQFLRFQDGNSLVGAIADSRFGGKQPYGTASQAIVFVFDGAAQSVIHDQVAKGYLPNIARMMQMGTDFAYGSLADYPTVTWANHNSIVTGASPGHHGIVNNSWFDRAAGKMQYITDGGFKNTLHTGRFLDKQVETLYEAVTRTFGPKAITASLNDPSGRGATFATLEVAGIPLVIRHAFSIVKAYIDGYRHVQDHAAAADPEYKKISTMDNLGASIGVGLLAGRNTPKLQVYEFSLTDSQGHHHGPQSAQAIAALQEADRNVGRVMRALEKKGKLDSTLLVLTSDHGMESQEAKNAGGWGEAIRRSGVAAVDDTRFVYIRNMRTKITGQLTAGVRSELTVRAVDDDRDDKGRHKPLSAAQVTVIEANGKRTVGTTDAAGFATIQLTPGAAGTATVIIEHAEVTPVQRSVAIEPHPHRAARARKKRH